MGVVYRGEHVYLGKEVAIKVLRPGSAGRAQATKWFLREARAASRISHPGIVEVTDFGKSADGTVFLVMGLIRGEPLDFLLGREGRLEPARAMNLALQIADAIGAAHKQGIVHRDLKPANVMVRTRGERSQPARQPWSVDSAPYRAEGTIFESVTLLDFGVAKMYDAATGGWRADQTITGTAEYIAPEIVQGMAIDPRTDIYSLGVILYEMLTGSVPFSGVSAMDTMLKAAADPVPPLRSRVPDLEVTSELDALLIQALAKRPENRHSSVEDFIEHLRSCRSRRDADASHRRPLGEMLGDGDGSAGARPEVTIARFSGGLKLTG